MSLPAQTEPARSWITLYPGYYREEHDSMSRRWPDFRISDAELASGALAYCGELIVDLGSRRIAHPVVLLYGEDTPFRVPTVIPIQALPTDNSWLLRDVVKRSNLARLPSGYRRHQMGEDMLGSICLVESRSEHEADIVRGADALRRAQHVFRAVDLQHTSPYPDSETTELEAHFSALGDIVLPEPFYSQGLGEQGQFWAVKTFDDIRTAPSYIPQSAGHERELIVGLHIVTTTPDSAIVTDWRSAATAAVIRAFPFAANQNLSTSPTGDSSEIEPFGIEGSWWQLSGEPAPVWTGGELATELERLAGVTDGVGMLADLLLQSPTKRTCHVGLRYLGRDGKPEWLFVMVLVVDTPDRDEMRRDLRNAMREAVRIARVGVFRSHPLMRPVLELRNLGRVPADLGDYKVVVLGCGALGADVAVALAKAGVGTLVLVDPDILHISNVIRHEAGLSLLGLAKPDAVRHLIHQHNPFINVVSLPRTAASSLTSLEELLSDADVAVSTIADENAEMVINAAAERVGRTVIYGRSLRRGTVARVFRVRPGEDACKECLARHYRDAELGTSTGAYVAVPAAEGEVIARECGHAVLAGSAVDLRIAADLTSRAVIDELGDGVPWNNLIWVLEPWPDAAAPLNEPYGVARENVARHPACTTCGRPRLHEVLLSAAAIDDLRRLTEEKPTVETGGVMIGYEENETLHILEITDSGPKAIETPTRFLYDPDYVNERLIEAAGRLGERGQYVGEWHSHLEPDPRPSPLDVQSFTSLAEAPQILTNEPAMMIMGFDKTTQSLGRAYAASFPIGRRMHPLRISPAGAFGT